MKKKFILYIIVTIICSNFLLIGIMDEKNYIYIFVVSSSFLITSFFITSKFFNKNVRCKIDDINHGLKMIEKGNYCYNLEMNSNDEFKDIAHNINKMKEKIKKREEELMCKQEQIRYLAYYDSLTGLPNRTRFEKTLSQALEEAGKNNEKLALLYLDLDNFKKVNDTIGHMFGDLLLKNVGSLLKKYLGESAMVTRLGGDEFIALLPKINDDQDIIELGEKIIQSFQAPWILDDREFYITVSMGIVIYPDHGNDVHILFKNVDTAMFAAKNQGKNRYCFYTTHMNESLLKKLEMENDLRHAVERSEFVVHYQPKIDIDNENIAGLEALVRWQHPSKGMVPPDHFIPLAEETGLIVPIGEWVLRAACQQNKRLQKLGYPSMYISVNLSVIQIKQVDFVERVKKILKETGIKPCFLELEITENTIMEDFEFTHKILHELRELGIRISLDDFGKGYSSLNYLKQLEIDVLKIDKSFIDDITENKNEQAIVKAVIDMAHSMKMIVVAEGVETWEQFSFLKKLNCDKVQGYLFSKPLPTTEIEKLLRKKKKVG